MIVDITGKEQTVRTVKACAILHVYHELNISSDIVEKLQKLTGNAIRRAWQFIPLLHPLPIQEACLNFEKLPDGKLKLEIESMTVYKTGIEMDVLFTLATCITYLVHELKQREDLDVRKVQVEQIYVEHKTKQRPVNVGIIPELELNYEVRARARTSSIDNNVYTCVGEGVLTLRESTLRLALSAGVEKGDPFTISKVCAVSCLKRCFELIPNLDIALITGCDVKFELISTRSLKLIVNVKCVNKIPDVETLFAVLTGLVCFWDVVKRYEKDEYGQYPTTRITNVRVFY